MAWQTFSFLSIIFHWVEQFSVKSVCAAFPNCRGSFSTAGVSFLILRKIEFPSHSHNPLSATLAV